MTPQAFIERLTAIFGEPKTTDADTFFAEYERILSKFDSSILDEACARVIDTATYWPRPSEIRQEANAVADAREAAKRRGQGNTDNVTYFRRPTAEERARAKAFWEHHRKFLDSNTTDERKSTLPDVSRQAFEKMQRESANKALHRHYKLTETSKRMTGDKD